MDVIGGILQKAYGGATKTKLMNSCGLSYKATKEYVFLMFEKGLLFYEPLGEIYRPSEKGLQYLRIYEEVNTMDNLLNAMKNNY